MITSRLLAFALIATTSLIIEGCAISSIGSQSDSLRSIQSPSSTWARALQSNDPDFPFFNHGPFDFKTVRDHSFPIGRDDFIKINIAIPENVRSAPVVFIQHGNLSFKEAHLRQMHHLASWGFIAITPQLKNYGEWTQNAVRLKNMVHLIATWPNLISNRVRPNKIILVGHSFGGSAVSLAAAKGAQVKGLVLLDPAMYSNTVWKSLPRINVPTFVLAADPRLFRARRREDFFARIPNRVAELTIAGSTHDDAQMPSLNALRFFGFDPTTSEDKQYRFLNSLTLAAVALAEPELNSRVWQFFRQGLRTGHFIEAKRK